MDQIIQSNQSSVILRSLADSEVQDLSYEISPSYPILASQFRELQPTSGSFGAMNNQEISFNINKSALLQDLMIRTQFVTATALTTSVTSMQYPGLCMFEQIQIKTNNKVIMTLSDAAIKAMVDHMPEHKKLGVMRRAMPLLATTELLNTDSTAATVTYTPLFASFFESVKNAFDLSFYEQLSVSCKFNTLAKAGFAGASCTLSNATLWVWTYRPDDKYYDLLRSRNQNITRPLNMLIFNSFCERQTCTSTTQNVMRLNVNYPVFKTFVMLTPTATGVALLQQAAKIDSVEFSVGGTKLIEACPYNVANWKSDKSGASPLKPVSIGTNNNAGTLTYGVTVSDASRSICFDWGLEPQNWLSNSGAISFSQINYPQITVNHQAITAANYEVVVVHLYWNILTLDSTNGSCQISINS